MEIGLPEKHCYWLDHLKQIDLGVQSSAAYTGEHHLNPYALYRWRSVLTKQGLLKTKDSNVSGKCKS